MLKIISYIDAAASGEKAKILFAALNYSIPIFMGIYLFANPLPAAVVNEFCFYLSVSALILLLVFRKTTFTLRSPLTLPFILFFVWVVFGLFFTLDFKNTLHDLRGHLLEYLIVFYLLVNYFNSQKKLEIISWIVIASATIFSVGAIIQYYFIEGFPFSARLGFTFKGAMQTDLIGFITTFASILSLHLFHKNKTGTYKILFVTCFLITTAATLLTQSRGALIGLCASFIILCFANKRNLIFVVLTALLIFLMPGMSDRIKNEGFTKDIRVKMNRLTIEVIKDHPIAGIGFGMEIYGNKNVLDLEKLNRQLPPEYQQNGCIIACPHNTILDIAVRTGVVGLALFLYILITSLWMLWKTFHFTKNEYYKLFAIYLFASLTSFLLSAFFADTTFGPMAIIFYTILAMMTILWNLARQEKTQVIIPSS
jgi:putative inorganic carbon (hco3(-)) transporter